MNEALKKFLNGVYIGAGIFFVAIVVGLGWITYYDKVSDAEMEAYSKRQAAIEKQISAELVSSTYANGGMLTLAKIVNASGEQSYGRSVQAEYLDEAGTFLGECESALVRTIEPNSVENIEILCKDKVPGWYQNAVTTKVKFSTASEYQAIGQFIEKNEHNK